MPEHDFAAGMPRSIEQVPRDQVLWPLAAALPAEMDDIGFRRIRRRVRVGAERYQDRQRIGTAGSAQLAHRSHAASVAWVAVSASTK
ncbi:MAG: hypothetical protein K0R58_3208 [Ramlibacter sp.]|jgi:hypothetical protein|nr:hypothetical protein [Ramlibacter sp.]